MHNLRSLFKYGKSMPEIFSYLCIYAKFVIVIVGWLVPVSNTLSSSHDSENAYQVTLEEKIPLRNFACNVIKNKSKKFWIEILFIIFIIIWVCNESLKADY